jgi:DNA-binding transcriptional ArsR family regulator
MNVREEMTNNTIQAKRDPEYLSEMSEYLNALANPTRLQILAALENRPLELKEITSITKTSYENIRKHLDKLVLAGLVRKDAGMSAETMTGVHPVWKFSLAPGGMEAIITNLSMFSRVPLSITQTELADQIKDVREELIEQFGHGSPGLYLTNGPEESKIYQISEEKTAIGRIDPVDPGASLLRSSRIILSSEYRSVSRITRPHCIIWHENNWEIEDYGSTSGTFVNAEPVQIRTRHEIHNGDIITLGTGNFSARFLFISETK